MEREVGYEMKRYLILCVVIVVFIIVIFAIKILNNTSSNFIDIKLQDCDEILNSANTIAEAETQISEYFYRKSGNLEYKVDKTELISEEEEYFKFKVIVLENRYEKSSGSDIYDVWSSSRTLESIVVIFKGNYCDYKFSGHGYERQRVFDTKDMMKIKNILDVEAYTGLKKGIEEGSYTNITSSIRDNGKEFYYKLEYLHKGSYIDPDPEGTTVNTYEEIRKTEYYIDKSTGSVIVK